MKHLCSTFILILFFISSVNAQSPKVNGHPIIIGIDCENGFNGKGRIFKIDDGYSSVSSLYEFDYVEGLVQYDLGDLCLSDNGKYYGVSSHSDRNRSYIFEYDIDSNDYKIVYVFDPLKFTHPTGGLVKGKSGMLYGVAYYGEKNPFGAIFNFDPQTYTATLLHSFDSTNANPETSLIMAKNNKLYGANRGGYPSPSSDGSFYEYDIQTNTYRVIFTFDGWYYGQNSNLVEGTDSCIYGVRDGSYPYYGRVYRYNYNRDTFDKIYEFDSRVYSQMNYNNVLFLDNNLYIVGNSVNTRDPRFHPTNTAIYKLDLHNKRRKVQISKHFEFIDSIHGGFTLRSIHFNDKKEIVGSMYKGGPNNLGTIFKMDTNFNSITVKNPYSKKKRVFNPSGSLIKKNDSTFVGFSENQPKASNYSSYVNKFSHGLGAMYAYHVNNDSIQSLIQFGKSDLGHVPTNNLVQAGNGKFYLANKRGGKYYAGTIIEYNLRNNSVRKVYDVDSGKIDQINNMILLDTYTLIGLGTKDSSNKVFEFSLRTDSFQIVSILPDLVNGLVPPPYNLTLAGNGKIYGVTERVGRRASKFIFEYDPVTKKADTVLNFATQNLIHLSPEFTEVNQKLYAAFQSYGFSGILEYDYNLDSVNYYSFKSTNAFTMDYASSLSLHSNGNLYGFAHKGWATHIVAFDFDSIQTNPFTLKTKIENYHTQSSGKFLEAPNQKFYFQTIVESHFNNILEDTSRIIEYDVAQDSYKVLDYNTTNKNCPAINNFILTENTFAVNLSEEEKANSIKLFPNPAKNQINISGMLQRFSIDIFNNSGQIIKTIRNSTNQIDISALPAGIYFIRLTTEDRVVTDKFIKLN